ncbi:hypothetical protein [Acetobacter sp. LMG 32666]|uniref:hypothetical protein n=1 Tax=Acetobacter sp. LMG 32666 TaxID=2959295 RepID=UPI0030C8004C
MDTQHIIQLRNDACQKIKNYVVGCFGENDCELRLLPQSGPHEMKRIADANGINEAEMETLITKRLSEYLTNEFKAVGSEIVGWMPANERWLQVNEMTTSLMQAIYGDRR